MSKENKQLKQLKSQVEILAQQKKIVQEKKAISETELSIAKSQKTLKEINLPRGETKPLEGTTSTDEKFGYVSELVAYHAMKSSAEAVGDQINGLTLPSESKILVVDKLNFAEMDFPLIQIENQFAMFENALDTQIKENVKLTTEPSKISELKPKLISKALSISPFGLIPHVPGIISSIADIAGYFKVDYNIKGQDFDLDSDAITAIVTGKISGTHDVHIINFSIMDESEILKRFKDLIQKRGNIEIGKELLSFQVVNPLKMEITSISEEMKKIESTLKELDQSQKEKEKIKKIEKQLANKKHELESKEKTLKQAESAILESENIMKAFDTFVTSVATAKEGQEQPLIVSATMRDYIRQMNITHLLYLEISSSGGEAITQKRMFSSGNTAYIGGSTISYILAQRDGKVIAGDTIVAFSELDYKIDSSESPKIRVVKLP